MTSTMFQIAQRRHFLAAWLAGWCWLTALGAWAEEAAPWPEFPTQDAPVTLPAQSVNGASPRTIRAYLHFPAGKRENVGKETGVMLSLHNWGGTACVGTADPRQLAARYNVVAICVDYWQSGPWDEKTAAHPYDFGLYQGLDALRALWFVCAGLEQAGMPYASGRIYCTGGSGGGNVTMMANKLAPRTFACVVDLCGMAKLSDDIAFGLPGGSDLNAAWSANPASERFLSPDQQQIRWIGNPAHVRQMRALGHQARVVIVHGADDNVCPAADKRELATTFQEAGLAVEPHFIEQKDLDGKALVSTGHALGNRTEIVHRFAAAFLDPSSAMHAVRAGESDFDRKETIRYVTPGGTWEISYSAGWPELRFVPSPP